MKYVPVITVMRVTNNWVVTIRGRWESGREERGKYRIQVLPCELIFEMPLTVWEHCSSIMQSGAIQPPSTSLPLPPSMSLVFLSHVLLNCISEHCTDWSTCSPSPVHSSAMVYHIIILSQINNIIAYELLGWLLIFLVASSIAQTHKLIQPAANPVSVNEAPSNGWEDLESHY